MKSRKDKRTQREGRKESQRLNRKPGAKNKKRESGELQTVLFGTSPEALTTTASLSRLFSRCVWPRTLLGCCQPLAPPLSIATRSWLVGAAQHCIAGKGWPPPPLRLTKITLFFSVYPPRAPSSGFIPISATPPVSLCFAPPESCCKVRRFLTQGSESAQENFVHLFCSFSVSYT